MDMIKLQMRKKAYNMGLPLSDADTWYDFLVFFDSITTNLDTIKLVWTTVKDAADPFKELSKIYDRLRDVIINYYEEEMYGTKNVC